MVKINGVEWNESFTPKYTPKELLEMGIFGGKYFNDIKKDYPKDWFKNARMVAPGQKKDVTLNKFKVDASSSISDWDMKGWILTDDHGWMQWYFNYYLGRRLGEEDDTQIKRWKSVIARHMGQVHNKKDMTPRRSQVMLHWSWDINDVFDSKSCKTNLDNLVIKSKSESRLITSLDKIKDLFDKNSVTIKTKVKFDDSISLSKYHSIQKAMYDRLFPLKMFINESLKDDLFHIEYPGFIEVEYYGSSYIREKRNQMNATRVGDVIQFDVLALVENDIRKFYTNKENGNRDPFKEHDDEFVSKMNSYKDTMKKLVLDYYDMKIFDNEDIDVEIYEERDKWRTYYYIRSKSKFLIK